LPLADKVMPGDTSDKTTLRGFFDRIKRQHGKAQRVGDGSRHSNRSVPGEMRGADPPIAFLVGTPEGRLSNY